MGQFLLPLLSSDPVGPEPEHFLIRHEDILQVSWKSDGGGLRFFECSVRFIILIFFIFTLMVSVLSNTTPFLPMDVVGGD